MRTNDKLRKQQLIVLIRQECQRLEYRMPKKAVTDTWELGYTQYVHRCLKSVGLPSTKVVQSGRWPEYKR